MTMADFMFWVFIMFAAFVAVKVIIYLFEKKKDKGVKFDPKVFDEAVKKVEATEEATTPVKETKTKKKQQ